MQERYRKVLFKGSCNKFEIYVQNCTQHLIIFANPLTFFARFAVFAFACSSGQKGRTEGGAEGLKALGYVFVCQTHLITLFFVLSHLTFIYNRTKFY